jgi:hypothetical protein
MGSGVIATHLGTRWTAVVSFTSLPLYLWGQSPRYQLHRRMGRLESRSRQCGVEKILFGPIGNRNPVVCPVA